MAVFKLPQTSFTSGSIDYERLRGRRDLKQYYQAAYGLHNVHINPQGGVYRRAGTRYLHDYTDDAPARLEVFEYSDDIRYLLVFYADNIDVWEDGILAHTITTTALTDDEIDNMDSVQQANSFIIVEESFLPKELSRGANVTTWTLAPITFTPIPLYGFSLSTSNPAATLTPSAVSSTVTLTASASAFAATDLGGYVSGNGGEARITKYISATKVEGFVTVPFVDTTAIPSGQWELENGYEDAWSASRGYPRCAVYHEDRLGLGGTPSLPDVVWFSAIGDPYNMDNTRAFADDALTFSPRSDKLADLRYMLSIDDLLLFTSASEHYVDGALTAELNFQVKRQDKRGTRKKCKPLFVDGVAYFLERKANILREFAYNDVDAKYIALNTNLLASHVLKGPVHCEHLPPAGNRDSDNIFVLNADGTWAVLNTLRKQNITGWTTGSSREDKLLDVKNLDGTLYALFERSIDGSPKVYLEVFDETLTMDCVKTYDSTATDTLTGYDHLEGEEVGILADGYVHENRTVSGGEINLASEYSTVSVGLKFTPVIQLLPPNREQPDGTMIAEIQRVVSVSVGVSNTFGLKVNGIPVDFYTAGTPFYGVTPQLFSGRKRVTLRGVGREPIIEISQDEPLPFHVTDAALEVRV